MVILVESHCDYYKLYLKQKGSENVSYHIDLWLDGCNLNIVREGGAFNIGNIFPFGKFIYLKTTEATERQQLYGETDVKVYSRPCVVCLCIFLDTSSCQVLSCFDATRQS